MRGCICNTVRSDQYAINEGKFYILLNEECRSMVTLYPGHGTVVDLYIDPACRAAFNNKV